MNPFVTLIMTLLLCGCVVSSKQSNVNDFESAYTSCIKYENQYTEGDFSDDEQLYLINLYTTNVAQMRFKFWHDFEALVHAKGKDRALAMLFRMVNHQGLSAVLISSYARQSLGEEDYAKLISTSQVKTAFFDHDRAVQDAVHSASNRTPE